MSGNLGSNYQNLKELVPRYVCKVIGSCTQIIELSSIWPCRICGLLCLRMPIPKFLFSDRSTRPVIAILALILMLALFTGSLLCAGSGGPVFLNFTDVNDSYRFKDCSGYTWQLDLGDGYPDLPSLRSGAIPQKGTSSICLNVTGPIEVGFWWKVDETPARVGKLTFYVDDIPVYVCSNSSWSFKIYDIRSPGDHVVKWEFNKTKSYLSDLLGAGWIDTVIVAPDVASIYNPSRNYGYTPDGYHILPQTNMSSGTIASTTFTTGPSFGNIYYNTTYYNNTYNYYNVSNNIYYNNYTANESVNKSIEGVYFVPSNITLDRLSITVDRLHVDTKQIVILNKSESIEIIAPKDDQLISYYHYYNNRTNYIPLTIKIKSLCELNEYNECKILITSSGTQDEIALATIQLDGSANLSETIDLSKYKEKLHDGFDLKIEFFDLDGRCDAKIVRKLKLSPPILVGDLDGRPAGRLNKKENGYLEELLEYCKNNGYKKLFLLDSTAPYTLETPLDLDFDLDVEGESMEGVVIALKSCQDDGYIIKLYNNHSLKNITLDGKNNCSDGNGCKIIGILIDNVNNKCINLLNIYFKNFGCNGRHCRSCELSNKGFGVSIYNSSNINILKCVFSGWKGIHVTNSKNVNIISCNFSRMSARDSIDDTRKYLCIIDYNSNIKEGETIRPYDVTRDLYYHQSNENEIGICI